MRSRREERNRTGVVNYYSVRHARKIIIREKITEALCTKFPSEKVMEATDQNQLKNCKRKMSTSL